nr:hypothetical protein [Candidatus Gracilibacteria bacterium]
MNYQALKGMLESIVKTYKCPSCNSLINENNVDIVGAAGTTVNIDIECSMCQKHSMIKAEMTQINLGEVNFSKDGITGLKNTLEKIKNNIQINDANKIKDEEIIKLSKDLKKEDLSISDLFSQE